MLNVEQACELEGIEPRRLFQRSYERWGLIYGLGPPSETFPIWEQKRFIPAYVHRHIGEIERKHARHSVSLNS